jgi:hypothetical protein
MIALIMAHGKPLGDGLWVDTPTSGNEKPQHCGAGARDIARVHPTSDIEFEFVTDDLERKIN